MHRISQKPPSLGCELSRKWASQESCASQSYHQCTQQLQGELFHPQPCQDSIQISKINNL